MACYLYSEGESQPAIPACSCHYVGQSCSFPHTLFSTSRPPSGAALMLILYLHYNTIVQRRSGCVVSLATPTKAEPLYKVHTHAGSASYL